MPIVPASKVGTAFQSPAWRYKATFCPERFGFAKYCSRLSSNSGSMARLIVNGVRPVETYNVPQYINQLASELPSDLKSQLFKVWNKFYLRNRIRKLTFHVNPEIGRASCRERV